MSKLCSINIYEPKDIIQHLRDMINVGPLLDWDLKDEWLKFLKQLRELGWSQDMINQFIAAAGKNSRWEKDIPSARMEREGSMSEWFKAKERKG